MRRQLGGQARAGHARADDREVVGLAHRASARSRKSSIAASARSRTGSASRSTRDGLRARRRPARCAAGARRRGGSRGTLTKAIIARRQAAARTGRRLRACSGRSSVGDRARARPTQPQLPGPIASSGRRCAPPQLVGIAVGVVGQQRRRGLREARRASRSTPTPGGADRQAGTSCRRQVRCRYAGSQPGQEAEHRRRQHQRVRPRPPFGDRAQHQVTAHRMAGEHVRARLLGAPFAPERREICDPVRRNRRHGR